MENEILQTTPDSEIVTQRTVGFPVDLVFRAWSEPGHLKNWWGPAGFTNTFEEFDFREGGRWRFVMHGPEKGHYRNDCEFIKIERPTRIAWKRHSQPFFQVVASFEPVSGEQTKVIFRQLFATEKECAKLRPYVEDKNEENMDRLERELQKMQQSSR